MGCAVALHDPGIGRQQHRFANRQPDRRPGHSLPDQLVVANGQKAGALYRQHMQARIRLPLVVLPSTSPANARLSLNDLADAWQVIRDCLSS